jgi:hypothetical protein
MLGAVAPIGRTFVRLLVATLVAGCAVRAQQITDLVRLDSLMAHTSFLAAPDMGGRAAGSLEGRLAANYIAAHFLRLGVRPAGDAGTYFQSFPVVRNWLDTDNTSLAARGATGETMRFELGKDFGFPHQGLSAARVSGPLVFAGYGVNAPEYGYNDFAALDLEGKIVLALAHEPQESNPDSIFKGRWHTIHAYHWHKLEQVRKAGAAGLLLVDERPHRPPRAPSAPTDLDIGPIPLFALPGSRWDLPVFVVAPDTANTLLRSSGRTIQQLQAQIDRDGRPSSFELPTVTVTMTKALGDGDEIRARNVVGLIDGADADLRDEVVVISAHYDHVGTLADRVYHGADDNASGTAAVLEIAEAFARGGIRPKRSVLFLLLDAEERGLLGAFHYVDHPVVPLPATVANLNLDMIGRDEDSPTWPRRGAENQNSVNVVGTLYSPDLRRAIESSNAAIGLALDYKTDGDDREEWFARSDHFAFATESVPHVLFNTGEHADYHTDRDTADRLNYAKMTRVTRLVLLTALELANSGDRPAFRPN